MACTTSVNKMSSLIGHTVQLDQSITVTPTTDTEVITGVLVVSTQTGAGKESIYSIVDSVTKVFKGFLETDVLSITEVTGSIPVVVMNAKVIS